jgi:hypothetical protein
MSGYHARALERHVGVRGGRSPSGKAPDFGSGIEGSNPSRPASFLAKGR